LGRRRFFGDLNRMGSRRTAQAEREAINMPVQGTAADIIKKAMLDVQGELDARDLNAKMTLQVHDELVFEVPEDELEETAQLVVATMEGAYDLSPRLKANAQVGHNWRDMQDLNGM
jgi:DNA polymerase-1